MVAELKRMADEEKKQRAREKAQKRLQLKVGSIKDRLLGELESVEVAIRVVQKYDIRATENKLFTALNYEYYNASVRKSRSGSRSPIYPKSPMVPTPAHRR